MLYIRDEPARYTANRWPRGRAYIRWLIVHDPATDNARPEAIELALRRKNARGASYNELVARYAGGVESRVLTPRADYAGHAGVSTAIPGTGIRNGQVNRWTWGISVCTYGLPIRWEDPELWDGLVRLVVHRIRQFGLPDAGILLAHREVSTTPGRRTDPRGISMPDLRQEVHGALLGA